MRSASSCLGRAVPKSHESRTSSKTTEELRTASAVLTGLTTCAQLRYGGPVKAFSLILLLSLAASACGPRRMVVPEPLAAKSKELLSERPTPNDLKVGEYQMRGLLR